MTILTTTANANAAATAPTTTTTAIRPSRRNFLGLAGLAGTAAFAAACGTANATSTAGGSGGKQVTKLRYQGSVGAVSPAELAADLGYLGSLTLDWVGNTISGPQDIQSAASGQTDFGGAFNGAVVKLHAAGAQITSVISYYGVDQYAYNGFYVLDGSAIHTAPDLFDKKIGMNTLGAHYEAVLDIYLQRNGVTGANLKKVEPIVVPPISTEQSLRLKQIDVGVLGGILRDKALAAGGVRPLFTDFDLLGEFSAGTYVFRNDFIQKNPDTVRTFTSGVGKAIEWARTTPTADVVARFTDIIHKRGRNEDTKALQYFKSWGIAGTGGVVAEKEISTWVSWLEDQGQIKKGQVTPSSVFTNKFNDYAKGGA